MSIIHMEGQTRGMAIKLLSGYLILINEALCEQARWRAFMHELKHILDEDFEGEKNVEELERGIAG